LYSAFQLVKKYVRYYLTAANGKGHGIHSPFVFDFIKNVLRDKKEYSCYKPIEKLRNQLLNDTSIITVEDFGAGSSTIKTKQRVVKDIAATSLKHKKYAQLLFRMVQYYKPKNIIELGTSFGISTCYMANGNTNAQVYTCEGATAIAAIAKNNFTSSAIENIELVQGDFTETLPVLLNNIKKIDPIAIGFAFIDGNHRKEPTLNYFTSLLASSSTNTILVFDDIHWSSEMEEAWESIKKHPQVTLSIDLFFIGIVFLNPDFKVPQHFSIRF
jgi:predicted O-methyltransferase YrrM